MPRTCRNCGDAALSSGLGSSRLGLRPPFPGARGRPRIFSKRSANSARPHERAPRVHWPSIPAPSSSSSSRGRPQLSLREDQSVPRPPIPRPPILRPIWHNNVHMDKDLRVVEPLGDARHAIRPPTGAPAVARGEIFQRCFPGPRCSVERCCSAHFRFPGIPQSKSEPEKRRKGTIDTRHQSPLCA